MTANDELTYTHEQVMALVGAAEDALRFRRKFDIMEPEDHRLSEKLTPFTQQKEK